MLTDPYAKYAQIRVRPVGMIRWVCGCDWIRRRPLGVGRAATLLNDAAAAADSTIGSADLLADMYTFVQSSLVFTDRRTIPGCDGS